MKKIKYLIIITLLLIPFKTIIAENRFDSVIINGNVYDSSTNSFLEKYNVGIKNGKIDTITRENIKGNVVVDASNKLVLPAFIDFQRHFGNSFDAIRLMDGVLTSIYVTDEDYDSFLLNNQMNISYINRILLKDITNSYAISSQEEAYTDFKSKVSKAISDGFAGFYIKPRTADIINISFIDDNFPLYINLEEISENLVIPFLNQLAENNTNRKIHIVAVNQFYNSIDQLLQFINNHDNFTVGGYCFSYINVNPSTKTSSYLNPLVNNLSVNKNNKEQFIFTAINFKDNNKYAIVNALKEEAISNMVSNEKFISESYDILPGSLMTTQDANTFMARLRLGLILDKISESLNSQTKSIRNIFNAKESPLQNKGIIQVGQDADIIIVDEKLLTPHSSIADITKPSTGITEVFREGSLIVQDGKIKENTPKARWIKRSVIPYELIEGFKINSKEKSSSEINAIKYNDKIYFPVKEVSEYIGTLYEENSGYATMGGTIRINIGSNSFSIGTNKNDLRDAPILINNAIYASEDTIKILLSGYYNVVTNGDELEIEKDSKASLLETPLNEEDININLDNKIIIYVYILSATLLIVLIIYLNNHKKLKRKRKEIK